MIHVRRRRGRPRRGQLGDEVGELEVLPAPPREVNRAVPSDVRSRSRRSAVLVAIRLLARDRVAADPAVAAESVAYPVADPGGVTSAGCRSATDRRRARLPCCA